jgi:hypothetical protein
LLVGRCLQPATIEAKVLDAIVQNRAGSHAGLKAVGAGDACFERRGLFRQRAFGRSGLYVEAVLRSESHLEETAGHRVDADVHSVWARCTGHPGGNVVGYPF